MTTFSINEACAELGTAKHTLKKNLRLAGITVKPGKRYCLREIVAGMSGDLRVERTRQIRSVADLNELELREKRRELFPRDEVCALVDHALGLVRQQIHALPAAMAGAPIRGPARVPGLGRMLWAEPGT